MFKNKILSGYYLLIGIFLISSGYNFYWLQNEDAGMWPASGLLLIFIGVLGVVTTALFDSQKDFSDPSAPMDLTQLANKEKEGKGK